MQGGANGQWVRTRTKEGREAFMAERRADEERLNRRENAASPVLAGLAVLVLLAVIAMWVLL